MAGGGVVHGIDGDVETDPGGTSEAVDAAVNRRNKRLRGARQDPPSTVPGVEGTHSDTARVKRPTADLTSSLSKRSRATLPDSFHRVPVEVLLKDLPIKYCQSTLTATGISFQWSNVASLFRLPVQEITSGTGVSNRVGKNVIGRKISLRMWVEGTQTGDSSSQIRVVVVRCAGGTMSTSMDSTKFDTFWLRDGTIGDINSIPNPQFFGDDKPLQLLVDEVIHYPARNLAVSTIAVDHRSYDLDVGDEIWSWTDSDLLYNIYDPSYYVAICGLGGTNNVTAYVNATAFYSDL